MCPARRCNALADKRGIAGLPIGNWQMGAQQLIENDRAKTGLIDAYGRARRATMDVWQPKEKLRLLASP
jgi:hypothetical protein